MSSTSVSEWVTVVAVTPDGCDAYLRLSGEIDLPARAVLADAVRRLSDSHPRRVVVDLADVTFAGATLLNLLAHLHHTAPGAAIVLRRPAPVVRLVIQAVTISDMITVEDESPMPAQLIRAPLG